MSIGFAKHFLPASKWQCSRGADAFDGFGECLLIHFESHFGNYSLLALPHSWPFLPTSH
jgi:hypothetical protein